MVNPLPCWLYLTFSLLLRLWVQIPHFHLVGLLLMPNSGAPCCLLLPNFNFYSENSIFNLRTLYSLVVKTVDYFLLSSSLPELCLSTLYLLVAVLKLRISNNNNKSTSHDQMLLFILNFYTTTSNKGSIASFSQTTILHGSVQQRISKCAIFFQHQQP